MGNGYCQRGILKAMDLESALRLDRVGDTLLGEIPLGWSQGRTTFGGLVGGYLVRAAERLHVRPVRSVDVYFLNPVPGGPVELSATGMRQGKYVSHVEITLTSGGRPAAVGRFLLADDEQGAFDATPAAPEPEKAFEDCVKMPYIQGITPEFTQNLDIRYGEGEFPFSGSQRAVAGGYVRNVGSAFGAAALLSHIDAWPPPVLALSDKPAAASTVRWHVQFHADVREVDGEQWSWFRGEAAWRSGKLATVVGSLVRDGRSVAYCEQTVAMYM